MSEVIVRPLANHDIPPAWEMAHESLRTAGLAYGWDMPDLDDTRRTRGHQRLEHCLAHDPDGAWVADRAGEIVGIGAATRRGPLWFLSLLTVSTQAQSSGVGRRLLDATLQSLGSAGALCASDDPKALRRYRMAGFAIEPCYEAKGVLDRGALPAVEGVRTASYDNDRLFIEEIAAEQRGTGHGVDLDLWAALGWPLFVTDTAAGRGYVVCTGSGVAVLGATTHTAARALLWTALAESTEDAHLMWLRHDQLWAVDVALEARLSLRPAGSFCTREAPGPMSAYIPNGAFG